MRKVKWKIGSKMKSKMLSKVKSEVERVLRESEKMASHFRYIVADWLASYSKASTLSMYKIDAREDYLPEWKRVLRTCMALKLCALAMTVDDLCTAELARRK